MKPPKLKPGDLVELTLLDHAEGAELPVLHVAGYVREATRDHIVIDNWVDPRHLPALDDNGTDFTRYCISRPDILRIWKISKPEVWERTHGT